MTVDLTEMLEHGADTSPYHEAESPVEMLAHLHHGVKLVFVAVAPFVIAAHGIAGIERGEHCPGWVAVGGRSVYTEGHNTGSPEPMVIHCRDFCARKGVIVAHKTGEEGLIQADVISCGGVAGEVAGVDGEHEAHTVIKQARILPVPKVGALLLRGLVVAELSGRTDEDVVRKPEKQLQ